MTFLLLSLAAASYVAGGIAMKWADGYRNLPASSAVFVFFAMGAGLQTLAMRYQSLGVGYVLVLGLEAIFAVVAGVVLFQETLPWTNALGVALVLAGICLLKSS
jgi:multidrug transporter EmrE-like cation transporter